MFDVGELSGLKCGGLNGNTPVCRLIVTFLKWGEQAKISSEGRAMSC
jgi:hypothetical protein